MIRTGENARRSTDGASRRWVLIVMYIGYFPMLLDVTIVNVVLPRIGSGLSTSVNGLQWVVKGYTLALVASMLAGGTLAVIIHAYLEGREKALAIPAVPAGVALFPLARRCRELAWAYSHLP